VALTLVLQPGTLLAGRSYRLVMAVSSAVGTANSSVVVRMASTPFGGTLAVVGDTPARGRALFTNFTATFPGWSDVAAGLPLQYRVTAGTARGMQLLATSWDPQWQGMLPPGDPVSNYTVWLSVTAVNRLGASTTVTQAVRVDPFFWAGTSDGLDALSRTMAHARNDQSWTSVVSACGAYALTSGNALRPALEMCSSGMSSARSDVPHIMVDTVEAVAMGVAAAWLATAPQEVVLPPSMQAATAEPAFLPHSPQAAGITFVRDVDLSPAIPPLVQAVMLADAMVRAGLGLQATLAASARAVGAAMCSTMGLVDSVGSAPCFLLFVCNHFFTYLPLHILRLTVRIASCYPPLQSPAPRSLLGHQPPPCATSLHL
jgi:hypothetical protein